MFLKIVLTTLLLLQFTFAMEHHSSISFSPQPLKTDIYGRKVYEINLSAQVINYTVPTLLARPVERQGTIDYKKDYIIKELNSTLTGYIHIDGDSPVYDEPSLDENGGSGERPFLLPYGASNMAEGEIRTFWLSEADGSYSFDPFSNDQFFPLDVQRDMKYTLQGDPYHCKGFFGFFTCTMDWFFNQAIGRDFFGHATDSSINYPNKRRAYLANIFYGIDKPHLVQRGDNVDTSTPAINSPLSLLDYKENLGSGCFVGGFFNFSSSSIMCSFIKTFSFDEWMPFVTSTDGHTKTSLIQEDTKIVLATLIGYKAQQKKSSLFSSFLGEFFKPMRYFWSILFPSNSDYTSETLDRNLSTNKPPLLMLPIVDTTGMKIEKLETFKLIALRTIAAKRVDGCQKRFQWGFFQGSWEDTDFEDCKDLIDQSLDQNDPTLFQATIQSLSNLFSWMFPQYKYRGTSTASLKLGITIQKYTPSIDEGNPVVEIKSIQQKGTFQ